MNYLYHPQPLLILCQIESLTIMGLKSHTLEILRLDVVDIDLLYLLKIEISVESAVIEDCGDWTSLDCLEETHHSEHPVDTAADLH